MKKDIFIWSCIITVAVVLLILWISEVAQAYEYTEPPSLKAGEYYVAKNPDGSYTAYRGLENGTNERGLTFTGEAMDQNLEDLGKSLEDGFDGGKNTGLPESMFNQVGGSESPAYKSEDAGTAQVQEDFVSVARTDGYLPSLDEVAASAGPAGTAIDFLPQFVVSLGVFAVGWEIGTTIDEQWEIPSGLNSEPIGESAIDSAANRKVFPQNSIPPEYREFCHSGGEIVPEGERWNEELKIYEQVKYGASENDGYYPLVSEGLCFIAWPQEADTYVDCIGTEAESAAYKYTEPATPEGVIPHGGCPYLETPKSREEEGYSHPKELNQTENQTSLGNDTYFESCDWAGFGALTSQGFVFAKEYIKEEKFESEKNCPGVGAYGALRELDMPKPSKTALPGKFKAPAKPKPSFPSEKKKPLEIQVPAPLQVKLWPKGRSREGKELPKPNEIEIPVPNTGETGEQYVQRLHDDGFPNTELNTLPDTDIDPAVGPGNVAYSNPAQESFAPPSTKIHVEQNPSDAPVPQEVPKPISGPILPGIKLPSFGVLCKGFPFGVPCWLAQFVEGWSATPTAPEWGIDNFEIMGHKITGDKVKLSALEPIMEKVRPAMVIFATVGLLLLFYRFAKGGSPPSGSGTEDLGYTDRGPSDGYEGMKGM